MITFGERLRFIRKHRNLTQKELGLKMGFPGKSADVRIAQYESDTRKPKAAIVQRLADALDVSAESLLSPMPSTEMEMMQMIFWAEEFKCIHYNTDWLNEFWRQQDRCFKGEISYDEYLDWKLQFNV